VSTRTYPDTALLAIEPPRRQCRRCHRSVAVCTGPYGRQCKRRQCKRRPYLAPPGVLDGFSADQIQRAWQLLEDGGLVATRRPGIYRAVASSGTETYLVAARGCACAFGRFGCQCYHQLTVRLLTAGLPQTRRAA